MSIQASVGQATKTATKAVSAKTMSIAEILAIIRQMPWIDDVVPANDIGAPPQYELIDKHKLRLNLAYQRGIESRASQKQIRQIVENFDWLRFGVLLVAPSKTKRGSFELIDGGHRTAASLLIEVITHLPCVLFPRPLSAAEAARIFVEVNTQRVAVNQYALWHARVASEDPEAMHLAKILDAAGITIPRATKPIRSLAPGEALCLKLLNRLAQDQADAPDRLVRGLTLLVTAYPEQGGQIRSDLIGGVLRFLEKHDGKDIDEEVLRQVIGARTALAHENEGVRGMMRFGGTVANGIYRGLVAAYDTRMPAARRLGI